MSDDIQRFNVMPVQPLLVEDTGENDEWWNAPLGYLKKRDWVKVADPIVWDGSDETRHQLHLAIGDTWWLDIAPDHGALCLTPKTGGTHASITAGWRVQIIGDTFAILPPEVTP